MDDIELGQNPIEAPSFQKNRCLGQAGSNFQPSPSNTDRIRIPFFSRKAWHFIVMSTLMLNGFHFALFCQSIMYQLGKIADQFGLAVAIFIHLRSKNIQVAKAELIGSIHLVDMIKVEQKKTKTFASRLCSLVKRIDKTAITPADYTQITEIRILRHFFLKTYHLPDLFPFSKYLRQAQDNQIIHMIEVEISTWIILLLLGWVMMVVADLFEKHLTTMEEHLAVVAAFMTLSWLAVALHLAIYLYFIWAINKLLEAASGDTSGSKGNMLTKRHRSSGDFGRGTRCCNRRSCSDAASSRGRTSS